MPGPGQYHPESFRSCVSVKPTQPFNKQAEFSKMKDKTLVEGSSDELGGLREAFASDIRNPPCTKFGKAPNKGRLNLKRLMQCSDRVWGVN